MHFFFDIENCHYKYFTSNNLYISAGIEFVYKKNEDYYGKFTYTRHVLQNKQIVEKQIKKLLKDKFSTVDFIDHFENSECLIYMESSFASILLIL